MRIRLSACAILFGIFACEGDTSGPPGGTAGEVEVDASSSSQFAYFDLSTGSVVTVADPQNSTQWDLAFRRYEVRLNGGVAGPKGVAGYNLANNANATTQEILAFTPANQKPAFDAIGDADVPGAGSFVEESLVPDPLGWLSFGQQGPVANPLKAWKLQRTAGGGFAVFHATALTFTGSTPQTAQLATVTIEWRYQPAAGALGAAQQVTIDLTTANTALDLSTGVAAAPTGCGWDLQPATNFTISVNAACTVGTFPLDASESFAAITTADDAPQYGAYLAGLTGAVPFASALDDPEGPFLYNLAGDMRLSPTYNIYLVQVGTSVYKFELIGYYNQTGSSGHPTIRYAQIR